MDITYYDVLGSCNKCGSNDCEVIEKYTDLGLVCEALNKCNDCQHSNYWAYGFYATEPDQEFKPKCEMYYFDHENDGSYIKINRDDYNKALGL